MKTCTNISWHNTKKSSKAALIPKTKEAMPKNRARIAHPLNKLKKFLRLLLSVTSEEPTSIYLVMGMVTGC